MNNKTNFLIDFGLLAAFLLAMEPRMTGENIHEWLSIGVGLVVIVHLLLHWDWIINIAKKYFANLWRTSRLNFFVDVLLFLGFNTIMLSGLMISKSVLPTLGISLAHSGTWKQIHSLSAELSMWMVAIHFGLHWRCILAMLKKFVVDPIGRLFQKKPLATVAVNVEEMKAQR